VTKPKPDGVAGRRTAQAPIYPDKMVGDHKAYVEGLTARIAALIDAGGDSSVWRESTDNKSRSAEIEDLTQFVNLMRQLLEGRGKPERSSFVENVSRESQLDVPREWGIGIYTTGHLQKVSDHCRLFRYCFWNNPILARDLRIPFWQCFNCHFGASELWRSCSRTSDWRNGG
jgi:hypothetical protein